MRLEEYDKALPYQRRMERRNAGIRSSVRHGRSV